MLSFWKSEPQYAYKRYAYKRTTCICQQHRENKEMSIRNIKERQERVLLEDKKVRKKLSNSKRKLIGCERKPKRKCLVQIRHKQKSRVKRKHKKIRKRCFYLLTMGEYGCYG